ncbi:MAG: hypothetical protein ABI847_17910, partial [Anaerolineales bacterium]
FTLRLRVPAHTGQPRFTLNNAPIRPDREAGGYYEFRREWSGDDLALHFSLPTRVRPFLNDDYGLLLRGPVVLAVDQRDNPGLELDQVALPAVMDTALVEPLAARERCAGQALVNGQPAPVLFTPYADCGGDGARFRTAFPVVR